MRTWRVRPLEVAEESVEPRLKRCDHLLIPRANQRSVPRAHIAATGCCTCGTCTSASAFSASTSSPPPKQLQVRIILGSELRRARKRIRVGRDVTNRSLPRRVGCYGLRACASGGRVGPPKGMVALRRGVEGASLSKS